MLLFMSNRRNLAHSPRRLKISASSYVPTSYHSQPIRIISSLILFLASQLMVSLYPSEYIQMTPLSACNCSVFKSSRSFPECLISDQLAPSTLKPKPASGTQQWTSDPSPIYSLYIMNNDTTAFPPDCEAEFIGEGAANVVFDVKTPEGQPAFPGTNTRP